MQGGYFLFDSDTRENYSLLGQEIFFDIFSFVTPDATFSTHCICTAVRFAQKCDDFALFHTDFQRIIIFVGDLAAAWGDDHDCQQNQKKQLYFFTHKLPLFITLCFFIKRCC